MDNSRTNGTMNSCNARIHLGVDPDVAAESSMGIKKKNEADERRDLHKAIHKYDCDCK
jgi:hypothetical protein